MAFQEGKASDAVIRVLEAREAQRRRDVRSPEKDDDPAPTPASDPSQGTPNSRRRRNQRSEFRQRVTEIDSTTIVDLAGR
jgi:hypothetical protein